MAAAQKAPEQDMVGNAIQQAKQLEYERGILAERINANRQLVRLLDDNNLVDENTGAWLDVFYPRKANGAKREKAEVEATRKAKLDARKEVAASKGTDAPTASDED